MCQVFGMCHLPSQWWPYGLCIFTLFHWWNGTFECSSHVFQVAELIRSGIWIRIHIFLHQKPLCLWILWEFPGGAHGKEHACQCRRHKRCGFKPWVRKIPWRRPWQPTPVSLPGESHGQRSLVGYSPRGHKESDTTEVT